MKRPNIADNGLWSRMSIIQHNTRVERLLQVIDEYYLALPQPNKLMPSYMDEVRHIEDLGVYRGLLMSATL